MACTSCGGNITVTALSKTLTTETIPQGNTVYNMPLKEGEALSTACERANIVGGIPSVINYPSFTKVGSGVVAGSPSMGGFSAASMKTFMRNNHGSECYSEVTRMYSTCAQCA